MKSIAELAREAGLTLFQDSEGHCLGVTDEPLIPEAHDDARLTQMLQRFAALVIEQERDRCAVICDEHDQYPSLTPRHCAAAIRDLSPHTIETDPLKIRAAFEKDEEVK